MSRTGLKTIQTFILVLFTCFSRLHGDEITAKNGERLTGKIVKLDGG